MLHGVVMGDSDSTTFTRDIAPFGVRMPPELKERIQSAAKANNRSMNAEIVAVLMREYPPPRVTIDAMKARLEKIIEEMPPEEVDDFLMDLLEYLGVTDEEMDDIPGVRQIEVAEDN